MNAVVVDEANAENAPKALSILSSWTCDVHVTPKGLMYVSD
jgi:hypothetical protein